MSGHGLLKESIKARQSLTLEQLHYAREKAVHRLSLAKTASYVPPTLVSRIESSLADYDRRIKVRIAAITKQASRDYEEATASVGI